MKAIIGLSRIFVNERIAERVVPGMEYKIPKKILNALTIEFLTIFRNQLLIIFNCGSGLDSFYDEWLFRNESSAGWKAALYAACKEINDFTVWDYISELEWDEYDLFNSDLGSMLIDNHLVLSSKWEIVAKELNIPINDLVSCVTCGHLFTRETTMELTEEEIAGTFYEVYEKRPLYQCHQCHFETERKKNKDAISKYSEIFLEIDANAKGPHNNPIYLPKKLALALGRKNIKTAEILVAIDDIENLEPYLDMRDSAQAHDREECNFLTEIIREMSYTSEKNIPENCLVKIVEKLIKRDYDFSARRGVVGEGCIFSLIWLYRESDMLETLKMMLSAGAVPYKGSQRYKSLYQMMMEKYEKENVEWNENYKMDFLKAADLIK